MKQTVRIDCYLDCSHQFRCICVKDTKGSFRPNISVDNGVFQCKDYEDFYEEVEVTPVNGKLPEEVQITPITWKPISGKLYHGES